MDRLYVTDLGLAAAGPSTWPNHASKEKALEPNHSGNPHLLPTLRLEAIDASKGQPVFRQATAHAL